MAIINSVLGPLDTADIGFTLMHEHILVAAPGVYRDYPELLGPNRIERMVVFPYLREMGVLKETVNGLCINGPRNFFEGA